MKSSAEIGEIKEFLDKDILTMLNIKYSVKGEGYYIEVYPSDRPFEENSKVSSIDISQCIEVLKKEYNISEEESLIISKIDIVNNSSITNEVEYKVYSNIGELLDLSFCDSVNTDVSSPIINYDLTRANYFNALDIDIFDVNSPFFNDICFKYNTSLKERLESFFTANSFCSAGCSYTSVNYTSNKVNCHCSEYSTKFEFKSLPNPTIGIVRCYESFDWSSDNIPFLFFCAIELIAIAAAVLGKVREEKSLWMKLNQRIRLHPPSKENFFTVTTENKRMSSDEKCIRTEKDDDRVKCILDYSTMYPSRIDNYPYNIACKEEQRALSAIFVSIAKQYFFLLRALCPVSQFEMISVNLLVYLLFISVLFSMNSLLFTVEEINSKQILISFEGLLH